MIKQQNNIVLLLRVLISALFLFFAVAKLYPTLMMEGITTFEEEQLTKGMGFSKSFAPYFSRFVIGAEFFLGITILYNNYLKKIIIPLAFIMIATFSIYLSTKLGSKEPCGCGGVLVKMTHLESLFKNLITLVILAFIYIKSENIRGKFSNLIILFFAISTIMFAVFPVSSQSKNIRTSSFSSHVEKDLKINEGRKILCFFEAGCEHCQNAAKDLHQFSTEVEDFPEVHIIFSSSEKHKINEFFEYVGKEFSYQVMEYYIEEEGEMVVNSYAEVTLGYSNPIVIYLENGNQIRFYEGAGSNEFNKEDLKKILVNE